MAQGTRKLVRVVATGLGALVCTGLVGCMGADKDKEKNKVGAKQPTPTPGLYGTPTIGANGTAGRAPAPNPYGASGVQQTGGGLPRAGSTGQNTLNTSAPQPNFGGPSNFGTPPATIGAPGQPGVIPSVQPGGFQPTGGAAAPNNWSGNNTSPSPAAPAGRVAMSAPPAVQLTDLGPIPPAPPGGPELAGALPGGALSPIAPPTPTVAPGNTVGLYSNK